MKKSGDDSDYHMYAYMLYIYESSLYELRIAIIRIIRGRA